MDDLNINWHGSIQVTMLDIYYKIWLSIINILLCGYRSTVQDRTKPILARMGTNAPASKH